MTTKISKNNFLHTIPEDFKNIILRNKKTTILWEKITPLAKNEWICWIESAKKTETRIKRIKIAYEKINKGDRRPCCRAGCIHRK